MSNTAAKALHRQLLDPLFRQHVTERALQFAAASIVLNLLQFGVIIWQIHRPVETHFFYPDQFGRPRELLATNAAFYSDGEIDKWAVDRVVNLYTMNFKNVREHLDEARVDFNVPGWNSWYKAFRDPGNIDLIVKYRAYVSAVPKTAPTILDEGVDAQNHYFWKLRFALLVKWENNQPNPVTDTYLVTMTVRKTTNPIYKWGIEIIQLDAPAMDGANGG